MQRPIHLDCAGRTAPEVLKRLADEVGRADAGGRVVLHVHDAGKVNDSLSRLLQQLLLWFHERRIQASIVDPSGCAQTLYEVLGGSVHVEVCRSDADVSRPLRILVVEDTPDSLSFLTTLLESAGHRVVPAASAQEALTRCAAGDLDLILIDVLLPDMDGLSVARELRETGIPMIAMSAYLDRWAEADYVNAGFRTTLRKPFKAVDLLAALRK